MNEIDNTVAELLALPDNEIASWYMSTVNCPDDMEAVALKALANAYTKAVADLATAKRGLGLIESTGDRNSADIAQQTLDAIGKE